MFDRAKSGKPENFLARFQNNFLIVNRQQ